MDEKELVLLAKQGDVKAFCALYDKYKRKLYSYAYFKLNNQNGLIFDYYKTDSERRYYGAFEIRISDNKISTAEYISENDNITESDSCISVGDYIYSIYKPDESEAKIFSYKYS